MGIRENRDEAVSPVIGVMLMLVVTIIVAAIVGVFVGNIGGGTTVAPSAAFDVRITSYGGENHDQYVMTFEHVGGDPVPTRDLRIQTITTLTDGSSKAAMVTSYDQPVPIYKKMGDTETKVKIPYLVDASKGNPGDPAVDFGNFTFTSGNMISSGTTVGTCGYDITGQHLRIPSMLGFDSEKVPEFGPGCEVEVKLVHIPSDKVIYSKKVIVH
jgi:FlaG/FlaF family flagellin (archaellin)